MNVPVDAMNISPGRVLAYRMLSPSTAFCNVNVNKLTYFKVLLLAATFNILILKYKTSYVEIHNKLLIR